MSTHYSFTLYFGFELDVETIDIHFNKSETTLGKFHIEDRFDSKTGLKINPVKVWDQKPKTTTWYEVDGEVGDDNFTDLLARKYNCFVERVRNYLSGDFKYVFFVNNVFSAEDYGNITVHNSFISTQDLENLIPKANDLKLKLELLGIKPGVPRVFIGHHIG